MTLGLTVGKFYPPHKGHKHLIETARQQADHLIVVLAHHPSQTIPGEVRRAWLQEIHPDCDIRLVPDELDNDSEQWAKWTIDYLGRTPDVVFTSEDYGPRYAELMGSRHVMVDRSRSTVPISATHIRRDAIANLDYLEACVRAYFVKRVVLIGAESTGKTTLAAMLADQFQTNWVPEYGREHWEKKVKGLKMSDPLPGWSDEEFVHIAIEQQRRENLAARTANKVLVCDTNAFATGTWFERYRHLRHPQVDAIGRQDKVDLYLLTRPDVEFVQDGFRDGQLIRDWMHDRFSELLASTGVPTVLIEGPYDQRWATAQKAVQKLLDETSE